MPQHGPNSQRAWASVSSVARGQPRSEPRKRRRAAHSSFSSTSCYGGAGPLAFSLAGLWVNWKRPHHRRMGAEVCVLTTNANELVASIHDRMPLIVRPEDYDRWLG